MAELVKLRDLSTSQISGFPQPIILCYENSKSIIGALSLNVLLAKELASIKSNRRTMRLERTLRNVLVNLPENPIIKDFDVLFNPNYEVDILRVMESIGKSKPYRIIWPGRYIDGQLIYAEVDYQDYKVFDVKNYNVTVVI